RWNACHHPFTAPKDEHAALLQSDPGKCLAKAYDLAVNGYEVGGGSVRIHRADVQATVFEALAIGPDEQQLKFGSLLDALKYGAPPSGWHRERQPRLRRDRSAGVRAGSAQPLRHAAVPDR
ncbi:MAG: hypothetical protein EBV57_08360, partial [Betaproteobacteria bacterium]|nr:hypothetical protein [Betaproteobacteria bacterium]